MDGVEGLFGVADFGVCTVAERIPRGGRAVSAHNFHFLEQIPLPSTSLSSSSLPPFLSDSLLIFNSVNNCLISSKSGK